MGVYGKAFTGTLVKGQPVIQVADTPASICAADGSAKVIGICTFVSDTTEATFTNEGDVETYLTDLVIGTAYYAAADGTITATAGAENQRLGVAVSNSAIRLWSHQTEETVAVVSGASMVKNSSSTAVIKTMRPASKRRVWAWLTAKFADPVTAGAEAQLKIYEVMGDGVTLAYTPCYTIAIATSTSATRSLPVQVTSMAPRLAFVVTNTDVDYALGAYSVVLNIVSEEE